MKVSFGACQLSTQSAWDYSECFVLACQGVQAADGGAFQAVGSSAADVLVKARLMALLGLARHAATISYQEIQASLAVNLQATDKYGSPYKCCMCNLLNLMRAWRLVSDTHCASCICPRFGLT
jgi:hypothetical protein